MTCKLYVRRPASRTAVVLAEPVSESGRRNHQVGQTVLPATDQPVPDGLHQRGLRARTDAVEVNDIPIP